MKKINMIRFAVVSDPQIGNYVQENRKIPAVAPIIATKPNFVLLPGDLTENGYDNNGCNWLFHNILCCNCGKRRETGQLTTFREEIIEPLESAKIPTFSVVGNHDNWTGPCFPVYDWVRHKHGGLHYKKSFDFIDIYGLSVYPTAAIQRWLRSKFDKTRPAILMFHYNLEGPFSDAWSRDLKESLWEIIRDGRVKAICEGHWHETYLNSWHGIPVVNGGGKSTPIVTIGKSGFFSVEYLLDN